MEKIENLTIAEVVEAKKLLDQLVDSGKKMEIDLSSLGNIDISGFQLLTSLCKEAAVLNKEVNLKGHLKNSFSESLNNLLFTTEQISSGNELTGYIEEIIRSN